MISGVEDLTIINIKPEEVRSAAKELLSKGARLLYTAGVDMGVEGIMVNYYFSFDHIDKNRHTIIRTYLDRTSPVIKSVTTLTREVDWSERELIEFLGVKVDEHPDPRHLWLPLNWDDMYMGSRPEADPGTERIKVEQAARKPTKDNIVVLPVTAIPYGPYHPAFIESNYLKMSIEDERVKNADLKLGFNHRSIVKLMERRDYYKDVFLAERICGICNAHHTQTFSSSVETIAGVQVTKRANLIRTLLCEMERVQSHLLAIGLIGDLMGFRTMLMQGMRIREDAQDALELVSGQRVTHGLITIGGVRRDITADQANFVLSKVKALKKSVPEIMDQALSNDVLVGRLRNVGVLKYEDAVAMGAVGPIARGSGWRIDVRKNSPYAAYEDVDWDIITEDGCDCLARLKMRLREVLMSLHIAEQCCDKLKSGNGSIMEKVVELPCREAIAKAEAPRGELIYHVASNGTNTPDFVRIRTPSFRNIYVMVQLLQGIWVGDVPAIIGSIDPCFSCTDRVTLLKGSNVEVQDLRSLGGGK
jgi:Ni,Fe-hydrogenase III large subunit/Ni,Fe-hydrogenase III component G